MHVTHVDQLKETYGKGHVYSTFLPCLAAEAHDDLLMIKAATADVLCS